MKRTMRYFSLLLAALLCASLLPLGALADEKAPSAELPEVQMPPVVEPAGSVEPEEAVEDMVPVPAEMPEELPPEVLLQDGAGEKAVGSLGLSAEAGPLHPGDEVTFTVSLEKNPGINVIALNAFYDPAVFEVVSRTACGFLTDTIVPWQEEGVVGYDLGNDLATEDYSDTGAVAEFVLRVREDAPLGETSLRAECAEALNVALDYVGFEAAACTVEVTELRTSGRCGDDLIWLLEDGVLRVAGSGAMYDAPFADLAREVTAVVISDGAASVGADAFAGFGKLKSLTLPVSVKEIGAGALAGVRGVDVYYAGGRAQWNEVGISPAAGIENAVLHLAASESDEVRVSTEVDEKVMTDTLQEIIAQVLDAGAAEAVRTESAERIKEAIEKEETVQTRVVVEKIEETAVETGEKTMVESVAFRDEVLLYLDVSVQLVSGQEILGSVTNTVQPLTFSIALSDAQMAAIGERAVYVVRVHDGVAERLPTTREGNVLTFETDKFSTYAVAVESDDLPGDVNGDGTVDRKDRIYLARYLAGWDGYEKVVILAADVNADGTVDRRDRIYLARHLAGWDGYETLGK